ncbi:MAG: hypothetical protein ACJ768_19495 [Gaiellaceae bacterium]
MDVHTITMDPAEAEQKLAEYRARKIRPADEEAARVEAAYRQLAKGTPLLILADAIAAAPRDAQGRPRLAIARADRAQVKYLRWQQANTHTFDAHLGRRPPKDLVVRVPLAPNEPPIREWLEGFSLVPIVPPAVLGNRSLKTHFVLWEVEGWADAAIKALPDEDPYLLRRLDDDLWAVVGEWDLTEVERAVMRGRATR